MEEQLIVRDEGDSLMIKAFRAAFDSSGHFYFETPIKQDGSQFSLITKEKKYNPVRWSQAIATTPYRALVADAFFSDTSMSRVYYKNKLSTRLYGPFAGKVRQVMEYGRDNLAIELCTGSTSRLYINNKMVNEADSLMQKWWCVFSDNGHAMYCILQKGSYNLYLDGTLLDSASAPITDFALNNKQFYTYVKQKDGKFTIHTPARNYGPFGAVSGGDLWNNGAWYYRGCADSQCYVLVNGKLFNDIHESHSWVEDDNGVMNYQPDELLTVEPKDADNFLFSYNQNNQDGLYINMNGTVSHHNYTRTGYIFYNRENGYAFYGSRPDTFGLEHTYRNVNGREKKMPYFKNGAAHAQCLQIGADGSSLYYYSTRDSVYLFHNDSLLCAPASRKRFFEWDAASALPETHTDGMEFFSGFNITDRCYIAYNNTISRPLPLINPEYDRLELPRKGNIVAGDISANGFFVIVNDGPGKYLLDINNKVYEDLAGIDKIFGDQSYFTSHRLVFYARKGNGFYQYTVKF